MKQIGLVRYLLFNMNICHLSQASHPVLRYLEGVGFSQLVQKPTHKEGRLIDHIFHYHPDSSANRCLKISQQSSYFSDHDLLFVIKVLTLQTLFLLNLCILGVLHWQTSKWKKMPELRTLGVSLFPSSSARKEDTMIEKTYYETLKMKNL